MSDLTGPGAEERDVDDEVLEALRPELADELALPGALDLEAAEGARGADHRKVASSSSGTWARSSRSTCMPSTRATSDTA
jgi:hypothetical protein